MAKRSRPITCSMQKNNIMNAFINEGEAQSGKKIVGHDADQLRAEAAAIRALIQSAVDTPI